jgi:hypothetical protein
MTKKSTQSKQPPAKYAPQSLTDDEFVACAIELGHRLSRHLDALESGEPGAVADVAAVLRTLLVRGDGDDVIRRLCKRKHIDLPEVLVTRAAYDRPLVILSAGAMPVTPEDADLPHQITTHKVNLNRWSDMTALVVRDGKPHRVNNWDKVIAMYANTFGSHLSGTIADTLSTASSIMSGSLDLGQYLVHCAGIVGENALNQVLAAISGDPIIVPHKPGRQLNPLSHLTLLDDDGRGLGNEELQVAFMGNDLPMGEEVDVLKLHFAARYIKATYARQADGKVYGNVAFSQTKPEWWDKPPR